MVEPTIYLNAHLLSAQTSQIMGTIAGTIFLVFIIVGLIFYRNWKYEQELDSLLWKVDFKDIQLNEDMTNTLGAKITR